MTLPAGNKFANKGKPGAGKAAAPKASRFGSFKPREEGPPMLEAMRDGAPAYYRVRFESAEECTAQKPGGQNTIKSYVEVVGTPPECDEGPTPAGSRVLVLHMQSQYGRADFNEQCVAFAGYDASTEEGVAEFLEFDPDGQFFAACVGDANDYAEQAAGMVGRLADVMVKRGKDDGKGGYYRQYKWAVVEDGDQDLGPKIEKTAAE